MGMQRIEIGSNKGCELGLEDGKVLVIKVDLTQDHGKSSTGKSNIIGSANGVLGKSGLRINCNVYAKEGKPFNKGGLNTFEAPDLENMDMSVDGTTFIARVDLTKEGTKSKNTDTILVGSTSGNRKIGGSNVFCGINITNNPKNPKDLSLLMTAEGDNFAMQPIDGNTISFTLDTSKTAANKSKGGNLVISTTEGIFKDPKTGISINSVVYTKAGKPSFGDDVTTPTPVNAKAQGLTYTLQKGKMTFYADITADYGETTSGASMAIGKSNGKIDGTNLSGNMTFFRRIAGRALQRPGAGSPTSELKSSSFETKQYVDLLKAVRKILAKIDGDIKVKVVLKKVSEKCGWVESDKLKQFTKKAINEVLAEEEEDEEEEEDGSASSEAGGKRKRGDAGDESAAKRKK
eukprot:TRINITY_DN5177_c0_g1_i1.p1 TRINITY_DN5177_c0_g1~~TRINITY_DN5177_c0_g1_i1.p1  ORF type:complete len:404 (+),score=190.15 TRINITY_DN5177_c0_g1_i1:52-1263(+)